METCKLADTVLLKVYEIEINSIKNFLAINKYLPENVPKNWGHKFVPEIHKYAILKNIKDRIFIIFSQRIGTIKKVYPITIDSTSQSLYTQRHTAHQKFDVLWQERDERNQEKGLGRHNQLETFYLDNLVKMSDIEIFLSQDDFVKYCEEFINNKKNK